MREQVRCKKWVQKRIQRTYIGFQEYRNKNVSRCIYATPPEKKKKFVLQKQESFALLLVVNNLQIYKIVWSKTVKDLDPYKIK